MIDHPPASKYVRAVFKFHHSRMELPDCFSGSPELGAWMLVVYRVGTCDDGAKCRKGDHILESLSTRAYNLGVSSLLLATAGLYDEALNSIRSLGELANVLAYLWLYPDDYPNWVLADKKSRLSRYSPSAIRAAIEGRGHFEPPMDKETYARLCEISTHVHGATAPNAFTTDCRRHTGGFVQEAGAERVASLLTYTMSMVALTVTKMVGREDLFEDAAAAARGLDSTP